jgi:2,3-bisphosphoglycerate-independent phosphoglycerate mutase
VRGRLAVCPDHGTDPADGRHHGEPVPGLLWGAGVEPDGGPRLTERHAADAPVIDASALLGVQLEVV